MPLLLDSIADLLASSPTIVSAVLVLLLAFLILQLLSLAKRVVLFWTRLAFRLAFYAGAVLLASVVYQRGLERSAADAMAVAGALAGWVAGLAGFWAEEYRKAQELQKLQLQQGTGAQGAYGGGGYRAQGYGGGGYRAQGRGR